MHSNLERKNVTTMWEVGELENGNEQDENLYPWNIRNKMAEIGTSGVENIE